MADRNYQSGSHGYGRNGGKTKRVQKGQQLPKHREEQLIAKVRKEFNVDDNLGIKLLSNGNFVVRLLQQ